MRKSNLGTNGGQIALSGGTFDTSVHPVTNSAGGVISGRGTIRIGGAGLTNNGQMQLSGGTTDFYGNVTGNSGSKILVAGNGVASFYRYFDALGRSERPVDRLIDEADRLITLGMTRRLKQRGTRWDADNAEALMALETLEQTDGWPAWRRCRAASAN